MCGVCEGCTLVMMMTPRCKPSSCSACPLSSHGTDFSQPEGSGHNKVMVVAEASGEGEARDCLPLRPYMPSGSIFERTLRRLGLSRDQFVVTNCLRCFASSKTMVLTPTGYQQMCSLRLGDLVLTHKGRYMPITAKVKLRGGHDFVRVKFKGVKTFHTVTLDHRYLSPNGDWIMAKDLTAGVQLQFLAEHCVICGKAFYRHFSGYGSTAFCSRRCRNVNAAHKGREKISQSLHEQYRTGVRNADTIALKANEKFRSKVAGGWHFWDDFTEEEKKDIRRRIYLSSAKTREKSGINGSTWIGFGEEAVAKLLDEVRCDYTAQFAIERYNYDFKIGSNLLVEIDGPGSRNVVRRVRDKKKEKLAEQHGYRVVHIPHENPEAVLSLLANDEHLYEFLPLEVEEVRLVRRKRDDCYSLTVGEDESFVAQGAVHHNCRPRENLLEGMYYEQEALTNCSEHLTAVLRQHKPKVLLALGNVAIRHLTGMSGTQKTVSHLRGYVLRALPHWEAAAGRSHLSDPLLVIPSYHPAFLRRGAIHLTGVFARDIARAVNVAAGRDRQWVLDLPDLTYYQRDPTQAMEPEKAWQAKEALDDWLAANSLRYQLHPTRRDLDLFCRDVKARSEGWQAKSPDMRAADYLALSWDLETVESASLDEDATDGFTDTVIRQVQFTIEPGQGLALDWTGEHAQATRWLMKLPLPKVGHNESLFDQRVVKAVGARDFSNPTHFTPAGTSHDTLCMYHRFQPDLPAHLQFAASFSGWKFPWKHLGDQCLPLYGVIDTDAALGVYLTVRKTLEDRKMWWDSAQPAREAAGYVAQVEQVRPVLQRMEERGFPVDDECRRGLDVEFEKAEREARAELDQRFPDEARKIHSYKTVPAQVKALLEEWHPPVLPAEDALNEKGKPLGKGARKAMEKAAREAVWAGVTAEDMARLRREKFQDSPTKNDDGEVEEGEWYYFDQRLLDPEGKLAVADNPESFLRWCRVYDFSPNSSPQLMAYMTARRHQIPQDKAGKKTTGKKELERLSAKYKDNFYIKVIECREIGKMRGTYIEGFRPHADGRVHTTFTFATATDQLSARNPNVTNIPKHGRLAKPIRAMFRDSVGGKLLVEWDKKSYHVMTTGWCARDTSYMRLARLDMHSFVTWHFLRLPKADQLFGLPDEELAAQLKWLKSDEKRKWVRDYQVKRAVLGIGYGMGVQKLYDMNREYFDDYGQARRLREMIERLFPKVFRWQAQVKELAHRQGYLRNDFGAIRWFYEVQAPDGKGGMKPGEQAEEAVAFLPASLAFGDMRELMKEVARRGLDEKWEQVNTVHDSLVYLVDPARLEEHCHEMYPVLKAPSKVLVDAELAPEGLVVDVEANAGENWADMKEVSLKAIQGQGAAKPKEESQYAQASD